MAHVISDKCIGCTACVRVCPVQAISGERKQKHILDPILCIDCSACGRVCPVGAVFDSESNPVEKQKRKEWLKPEFDMSECIGCASCAAICPAACITMIYVDVGEEYPELNAPNGCVACAWCADICPVECIRMKNVLAVKQ